MSNCPACSEKIVPNARFCSACGERLNQAPSTESSLGRNRLSSGALPTRQQERKQVTILFADIVGSTRMIEKLDAEVAMGLFSQSLRVIKEAVEEFGGVVSKEMGDGIMAIFGAPISQEDHAIRAAYAALEMQNKLDTLRLRLHERSTAIHIRVGLNSGSVIVTGSGDDNYMQYDAIGSTVHLAARMESSAKPDSVYLSQYTYLLIQQRLKCTFRAKIEVKGISDKVATYSLQKSQDDQNPSIQGRQAIHFPLIGRRLELDAFTALLGGLRQCKSGLYLLTGIAGMGKSRLIAEAEKIVHASDVLWLHGGTSAFGSHCSYQPFREIIQRYLQQKFNLLGTISAKIAMHKIDQLFEVEDGCESVAYLGLMMGYLSEDEIKQLLDGVDGETRTNRMLQAVWRLFEMVAREQPLIVVIEDLHWIDGGSLRIVKHLLRLAQQEPLLVMLTSRPQQGGYGQQILQEVGDEIDLCSLSLGPLSSVEQQQLLHDLIEDTPHTGPLKRKICQKSEGNPYFTEEILRSLVEQEKLIWNSDRNQLKPGDARIDMHIPDSIQSVIMERVDRLSPELKDLLGVAAVIGRTFFLRVISAVTEGKISLDEELQLLQQSELIESDQAYDDELAYLFKHALAQEAVYNSLLIEKRKGLHLRVAGALEELFADSIHEVAAELAYHYTSAEAWQKAQPYLLSTAEQANQIAADDEALAHYNKAIAAYEKSNSKEWSRVERSNIECNLAEIYFRRGEHSLAIDHIRNALQIFADNLSVSRPMQFLDIGGQIVRQLMHRFFPALFIKREYQQLSAGDLAYFRILELMIWTLSVTDHDTMLLSLFKVLNFCERKGYREGMIKSYAAVGFAMDLLGFKWLAESYHHRSRELLQPGDETKMSVQQMLLGYHYLYRKEWGSAITEFDRSHKNSKQEFYWIVSAWELFNLYAFKGHFSEARRYLQSLQDYYQETASPAAGRWINLVQGITLWLESRVFAEKKEYMSTLERAAADFDYTQDIFGAVAMMGVLGQVHLLQGDREKASNYLEQGESLIKEHRVLGHNTLYVYCGEAMLRLTQIQGQNNGKAEAERACRFAVKQSRKYSFRYPLSLTLMGEYLWLEGREEQAQKIWLQAIDEADKIDSRYEEWEILGIIVKYSEKPDYRKRLTELVLEMG